MVVLTFFWDFSFAFIRQDSADKMNISFLNPLRAVRTPHMVWSCSFFIVLHSGRVHKFGCKSLLFKAAVLMYGCEVALKEQTVLFVIQVSLYL